MGEVVQCKKCNRLIKSGFPEAAFLLKAKKIIIDRELAFYKEKSQKQESAKNVEDPEIGSSNKDNRKHIPDFSEEQYRKELTGEFEKLREEYFQSHPHIYRSLPEKCPYCGGKEMRGVANY